MIYSVFFWGYSTGQHVIYKKRGEEYVMYLKKRRKGFLMYVGYILFSYIYIYIYIYMKKCYITKKERKKEESFTIKE
jgi:hypothetical protein